MVDDLFEECRNESEAARLLWGSASLPSGMESVSVLFVVTPLKQEGGVAKRPNTYDTLVTWLQGSPEPCKVLFISDQPFCGYQFAVINSTLPDSFTFDVVGPAVNPFSHSSAAAITLDSIARQLYQESITLPGRT